MNTLKNLVMQIKSRQEILNNAKASVARNLSEIVEDENIPLFKRWCLFMEYGTECFPVEDWTFDRKIRDLIPYDLERYRTYVFSDCFEELWITEDHLSNPPEWLKLKEIEEDFNKLPKDLVEEIITSGCSGFTHDW